MYRLGEVRHSHRKFYAALAGFIVLVVIGAAVAAQFLRSDTHIDQPPAPVTTKISYDTTQLKLFEEPLFTMELPSDWKSVPPSNEPPQPTYTWTGTSKTNNARRLSVFIDKTVATLAVNRELYVQGNGSGITVLSDVSDNCTSFTGNATPSNGSTPAKWQGIDFLCDSGNYERDVVGIASPDGLNSVKLQGPAGTYRFFFTYTDNSISPDYSIFVNALKSLKLK